MTFLTYCKRDVIKILVQDVRLLSDPPRDASYVCSEWKVVASDGRSMTITKKLYNEELIMMLCFWILPRICHKQNYELVVDLEVIEIA